jgi:hypothetical protein
MRTRILFIAAVIFATAGCGTHLRSKRSIAVHGDSTAIASRIPAAEKFWNLIPSLDRERWWNILSQSYNPVRPIFNDGVHGQSMKALRDKMLIDTSHRDDVTIIYDRRNAGEQADVYVTQLGEAVSTLSSNQFLILPQVNKAKGIQDEDAAVMHDIDDRVLCRWPNNTFTPTQRAAFAAALADPSTRADGLHRNRRGQAIEAKFIRAWLDAKGW